MKVCIVGGAGFIGSHFTDRLLGDPADALVSRSTTTSPRAASGTSNTTSPIDRLAVVTAVKSADLDALMRSDGRARHW